MMMCAIMEFGVVRQRVQDEDVEHPMAEGRTSPGACGPGAASTMGEALSTAVRSARRGVCDPGTANARGRRADQGACDPGTASIPGRQTCID